MEAFVSNDNQKLFYTICDSTFLPNGDMLYTNVSKRRIWLAKLSKGAYSVLSEAGFGGAQAFAAPDDSS
jgi:hypothetical protein